LAVPATGAKCASSAKSNTPNAASDAVRLPRPEADSSDYSQQNCGSETNRNAAFEPSRNAASGKHVKKLARSRLDPSNKRALQGLLTSDMHRVIARL
jgi:hypothetical protein